ncbi:MAG: sugar ABC transporter permease [Eubacteriales bacterium]|nr:sugar ABC transporter permease [Eubacteriales bacterium]
MHHLQGRRNPRRLCITCLPMIASFALSLFNWNGLGKMTFVGLDNYVKLFTGDSKFYGSLWTTMQYAGMSVVLSIVYSMIITLLLNRKIPARGFFRAIFYLPYVLPAMAVYLGWKWLYDYNHGLFNYVVKLLGGTPIKFLDSSTLVTPSLTIIAVWLSGNLIVIFLAGLQNVPRTYHEAAEIDGANAWQRFWKITIPCMTPSFSTTCS